MAVATAAHLMIVNFPHFSDHKILLRMITKPKPLIDSIQMKIR